MRFRIPYIIFPLITACCFINVHAQEKPKGNYGQNKEAIKASYINQMKSIGAKRNLAPHEKKAQRDAAIDKYLADKRANRVAFRKNTNPNNKAMDRINRSRVPRLHKD